MKKKTKIIYISLFLFIFLYFLSGSIIGQNSFLTFKKLFSENLKNFIKKTIFVYHYQKILEGKLQNSLKKISKSKNNQEKIEALKEKKILDLIENYGFMNVKKNNELKDFIINEKKISVEKFEIMGISVPKYLGKGTAYLEYFDKNLFITTANGMFSYVNIGEFEKDSFQLKIIKSNIKDKIKYDKFYIKSQYGIKDTLISNNQIFISYLKQQNDTYSLEPRDNCYYTSIMVADLNYEYLEFKDFFTPKKCIKENEFNYLAHLSGGRIVEYKDNKLLFSIGDYQTYIVSQDRSNFYGKIISLNLDGNNPQIVSMGHRNPQGLFYDKKNDIIFNTEHGPVGGDEVNYNLNPNDEIKNYGWPISSYGEHKPGHYDYQLYKKFPLHKSHSEYGFVEPLKYFVPSIGISEIIKLKKNTDEINSNVLLVASMGSLLKEGDLSLHYIKINSNFEIVDHHIIKVNERIRDIKYIEELNKVFLFYETSAAIGVFTI